MAAVQNGFRLPIVDGPNLMNLMLAEHDHYPEGLALKLRGALFTLGGKDVRERDHLLAFYGASGGIRIVILGVKRAHPGDDKVEVSGIVHTQILRDVVIRVRGNYSVKTRKGSLRFICPEKW